MWVNSVFNDLVRKIAIEKKSWRYGEISYHRFRFLCEDGQVLAAQNWRVYQEGVKKDWLMEDLVERKRLYGVRKVLILYLRLNYQKGYEEGYEVSYKISVKKKLSAYINRLLSILSLSTTSAREAVCANLNHFWGIEEITLQYRVSDITIEPNILTESKTQDKLGDAVTLDNELLM